MKVHSITYTDYFGQVHPSGIIFIEKPTVRDIVDELHNMLGTSKMSDMESINAFSEQGRFFVVSRKSFVVTYYGQF